MYYTLPHCRFFKNTELQRKSEGTYALIYSYNSAIIKLSLTTRSCSESLFYLERGKV